MNIAFPALLLFILVLPGFIFYTNYYRLEDTILNFSSFGKKFIAIFILAIVYLYWVILLRCTFLLGYWDAWVDIL
jgi:hypothetical protein